VNLNRTRIVVIALALLVPVLYLLATGDYPGAHLIYGLQEDHWLVTMLLTLH
jgi:hypothetical protein